MVDAVLPVGEVVILPLVGDELEELDADPVGGRKMGDLHPLEVRAVDVGDDLTEVAAVGVALHGLHQHVAAEDVAVPGDGCVDVGHRDADVIERPRRPFYRSRRSALSVRHVLVLRDIPSSRSADPIDPSPPAQSAPPAAPGTI